jgi:hypothetical protein
LEGEASRLLAVLHGQNLIKELQTSYPTFDQEREFIEETGVYYGFQTEFTTLVPFQSAENYIDFGVECPPQHPEHAVWAAMVNATSKESRDKIREARERVESLARALHLENSARTLNELYTGHLSGYERAKLEELQVKVGFMTEIENELFDIFRTKISELEGTYRGNYKELTQLKSFLGKSRSYLFERMSELSEVLGACTRCSFPEETSECERLAKVQEPKLTKLLQAHPTSFPDYERELQVLEGLVNKTVDNLVEAERAILIQIKAKKTEAILAHEELRQKYLEQLEASQKNYPVAMMTAKNLFLSLQSELRVLEGKEGFPVSPKKLLHVSIHPPPKLLSVHNLGRLEPPSVLPQPESDETGLSASQTSLLPPLEGRVPVVYPTLLITATTCYFEGLPHFQEYLTWQDRMLASYEEAMEFVYNTLEQLKEYVGRREEGEGRVREEGAEERKRKGEEGEGVPGGRTGGWLVRRRTWSLFTTPWSS